MTIYLKKVKERGVLFGCCYGGDDLYKCYGYDKNCKELRLSPLCIMENICYRKATHEEIKRYKGRKK